MRKIRHKLVLARLRRLGHMEGALDALPQPLKLQLGL